MSFSNFNVKATIVLLLIILYPARSMADDRSVSLPHLLPADVEHANHAKNFAYRGNWDAAYAHARKANSPVISSMITWWKLKKEGGRFEEYKDFLNVNKGWPLADHFEMQIEKSMDDSIDYSEILKWFEKHTPKTIEGKYYLAKALLEKNNNTTKRAKELIREVWREMVFPVEEEWKFLSEYRKLLRTEDHIERTNYLLWNKEYSSVRRMLSLVPAEYKKLFDARMALQRDMFGVDSAVSAVPYELEDDEGLLYDRIRWRERHKSASYAIKLLQDVPSKTSYPTHWWRVKENYIRELLDRKKYDLAYKLTSEHGFKKEDVAGIAKAEWLAGWISLRFMDNARKAYTHFYRMYNEVKTPISRARAAYWAGRAAEENDNLNLAREWYLRSADHPNTFYGQHARNKLGQDELSEEKNEYSWRDEVLFKRNNLVKAAIVFYRVNMPAFSRIFWEGAVKGVANDNVRYLIASAASNMRTDFGVAAAKAANRVYYQHLWDVHYPVVDMSSELDILNKKLEVVPDRSLISAIILQETIFIPKARSPVGALGIMQLMPATAREVARKLGQKYSRKKLIEDNSYNRLLGSAYLGWLLEQFDGEEILVAAAYNGGIGNVRQWIRKYGDPRKMKDEHDKIDWIERITFRETRNYVQRVLEHKYLFDKVINRKEKKSDA